MLQGSVRSILSFHFDGADDKRVQMKLSDNERLFLQTIADGDYATIAQVTQACGFQRTMGLHYYRTLLLGGLVDGFEPTYLGYKLLNGDDVNDSSMPGNVGIKVDQVKDPRKDL